MNNYIWGDFLKIQKDSWGNFWSNGATVTLNLTNNSYFTGSINKNNEGEVSLVLDKTTTITLTGNTYVKKLTNADKINSNINFNGYKLYIDGIEFTK